MSYGSMLGFFAVVFSLNALLHYYLWKKMIQLPEWPQPWRRRGTSGLVLAGVSVLMTYIVGRFFVLDAGRVLLLAGYTWIGSLFLFFLFFLFVDVVLKGLALGSYGWRRGRPDKTDPDRRRVLGQLLTWMGMAVVGGATGWALHEALGRVRVKKLQVTLSKLPSALDGMKLVQLTDLHIGPTLQREFLEGIVEQTNALGPDVIAITGDLVDGSVEALGGFTQLLKRLKARHGVYFVTGNHEYYSGAEAWCEELTRLGIRVLRNERVRIGKGDASFDLVGVDDFHADRYAAGHGADLEKALQGRDLDRESVLLAHQPRAVHEAERLGVGLQLSGHTHGGQLWPWNWLVRLQQPVVSGLAAFGKTQIYVSQGTGFWGPPMRLGTHAEITEVRLRSGDVSGSRAAGVPG